MTDVRSRSRLFTRAPEAREAREASEARKAPASLTLPARGDLPHILHAIASHHVELVVEIHCGIAMRRHELDAVADLGLAIGLREIDSSMFVARPRIGCPAQVDRF